MREKKEGKSTSSITEPVRCRSVSYRVARYRAMHPSPTLIIVGKHREKDTFLFPTLISMQESIPKHRRKKEGGRKKGEKKLTGISGFKHNSNPLID